MIQKTFPTIACLVSSAFIVTSLQRASAATNYIGDAASEGLAVTDAGGTRADSVVGLTYVLHTGSSLYTAPVDQNITLTEVNFYADVSGTLTPFVVLFSGGSTQTATNYTFLAIGDALTVTSSDDNIGVSAGDHVENRAFTIGGSNPSISLSAGDQIAAGWYQDTEIVFQGPATSGASDYIAQTNSISSVGSSPTANSNFNFDRTLAFNIGFDPIPEPSSALLLGLSSLGLLVRRKR